VTSFFRDPPAFEVLAAGVIPQVLPTIGWVAGACLGAGCATGEEAVSIAMLFMEAMDKLNRRIPFRFLQRRGPEAIQRARVAYIRNNRLGGFAGAPGAFPNQEDGATAKERHSDSIVFAVQDLVADLLPRLDLISCRNVLIYMDPPLQKKIMNLFHFTLSENGYLFLGHRNRSGILRPFLTCGCKGKDLQAKKLLAGKPPCFVLGEFIRTGRANRKGMISKWQASENSWKESYWISMHRPAF